MASLEIVKSGCQTVRGLSVQLRVMAGCFFCASCAQLPHRSLHRRGGGYVGREELGAERVVRRQAHQSGRDDGGGALSAEASAAAVDGQLPRRPRAVRADVRAPHEERRRDLAGG